MKVQIGQIVKGIHGKPFKTRNEHNIEVPLTLGASMMEALLAANPQDQGLPGNIKMAYWNLAKKIKAAMSENKDVVDISTQDLGLIKNRVLQVFDAVAAGPVCDLIEGDKLETGTVQEA